jgi:glycosyltransferase involved in cell wall biosynthesis
LRIIVASTFVPFIEGGARLIVDSLVDQLTRRGHIVDTILLPLRSFWPEIAEQTMAMRLLDVSECAGEKVDLLITVRYPSYALRHPNKVAWFIHHHRGAYDLWGTQYQDIPSTPEGLRARQSMVKSDNIYLREARKIFTNSRTVADRLRKYNDLEPTGVLFPPLPNPEMFYGGDYGDYFLYVSRLTPIKRQSLAIEAMKHVRSGFKLVLAGTPDVESYWTEIHKLIKKHGVEDRVELRGWVSEEEKAALTADATAALYIPHNEDSYGYPTLEAFHASKAVITCIDSGGTEEVVRDGVNGRRVMPNPEAVATAMEQLWADKSAAIRMGKEANATLAAYKIDWDHVISGLTE